MTIAKVVGHGPFPMDMLRYDRAFPYTESDSVTISSTFYRRCESYEVLVVTNLAKFTVDRWRSFGVSITPVKR